MHIKFISLVFFLSGCSALVFETIWFRVTSIVLGSSIWSAVTVLSAFMAGLAIGNTIMAIYGEKFIHPFRTYILIEIIIGLTGVGSVFFMNFLSTEIALLLSDITNHSALLNFVRFVIAFSILLIPSVAMGMTLPILHKGLFHFDNIFSRSLGKLYGWNTLGAVSGVLLSEFLFISFFGIKGTALSACLFNFIAAFILMQLFYENPIKFNDDKNKFNFRQIKQIRAYILPPFLTGFLLLALEIIWFRYLLLSRSGTSVTFAIMLATILAGIGLGGLIATRIKTQNTNLHPLIINLSLIAAISVVASFFFHHLLIMHFMVGVKSQIAYSILSAVVLMLPTSIISGMLFPLYGEVIYRKLAVTTQASGLLTLFNTTGAALGSAFATFLLLPLIGVENSILILALGYVFLSLLMVINQGIRTTTLNAYITPLAIMLFVLVLFPYGSLIKEYKNFNKVHFPNEKLVQLREGLNETIQYFKQEYLGEPLYFRLVTNSVFMSGTDFTATRYMKMFAYLPYVLKDDIQDVLLISYGVGNTAEAITKIETLNNFDVVDISEDVLELSTIVHDTTGIYPLRNKKTNIHIEDGRFFLQTTKNRYDLITGEPPPPKIAGVVNLYTKEYFDLIFEKLNPGGIATYWLPVYQLPELDALAIIKSFCLAFTDCSLWQGVKLELILMGSRGGINTISTERFRRIWDSEIGTDLKSMGIEQPGLIGTMFLADHEILNNLTKNVPPVTDNHPQRISISYKQILYNPKLYKDLLDIKRRYVAFDNSQYIDAIFSRELIKETLDSFPYEDIIARLLTPPMRISWEELKHMLSDTNLETIPLLALSISPRQHEIIEIIQSSTNPKYQLAYIKTLIVKRRYEDALDLLKIYIKSTAVEDDIYLQRLYNLIKNLYDQTLVGVDK